MREDATVLNNLCTTFALLVQRSGKTPVIGPFSRLAALSPRDKDSALRVARRPLRSACISHLSALRETSRRFYQEMQSDSRVRPPCSGVSDSGNPSLPQDGATGVHSLCITPACRRG